MNGILPLCRVVSKSDEGFEAPGIVWHPLVITAAKKYLSYDIIVGSNAFKVLKVLGIMSQQLW